MKFGFYSRIAVSNIKKNPRLYIPRILSEAGLLGCFYIMFTLALDERLASALGGSYLPTFMWMGAVVLGLLSFILILYVNSFLMKQRKNEYGLYNVLGMEKRHISRVLFCESAVTMLMALVLGIVFGILFYKLSSLLVCKLLHADIVAGFYYLSAPTVLYSALIYAAFDLFAFLVNSITVYRLKPVELLAGKHTGEREPRVKWVLLIVGILTLGCGYYISLSIQSPLQAITLFFVAVILVIIGTYCLFITGTTFILKCLKRNKKYYYNKKHMSAVSGLLFRMKQNAVGLASIAILATGVLVMISTTVSLYSGVQDSVNVDYPHDLYLSAFYEDGDTVVQISSEELSGVIRDISRENNLEIAKIETEQYLTVSYLRRGETLLTKTEVTGGWSIDEVTSAILITEKSYSQMKSEVMISKDKRTFDLDQDEIVYCRISSTVDKALETPKTLTIHGKTYKVKETIDYFPVSSGMSSVVNVIGVVVSDETVLDALYQAQKAAYGRDASEYADRICVEFTDYEAASNVGTTIEEQVFDKLGELHPAGFEATLSTKWGAMSSYLGLYGTFLFLGILLGFVCLFATILIIYYKQISEGYEDRERFQIMEKVGMEPKAVKRSVSNQLTLQFFLPLITAAVHTAMAFPILLKLLKILRLSNTMLFVLCAVITFGVFALVYVIVYLLTARTYYKIVH